MMATGTGLALSTPVTDIPNSRSSVAMTTDS